jgi:CRISPR-associated endoribonuclease Cas6
MNKVHHPAELMATIFYINALQDGQLRATHGRYTHACFFSMFDNVSPELADKYHQSHQERPFTVSTIYPCQAVPSDKKKDHQIIQISKGKQYWFRISTITWELCQIIQEICYQKKRIIRIDSISFELIQTSHKNHSRAGLASYKDIGQFLKQPPPFTYVLQILSPTAFHSRNKNMVFPIPTFVFPRLLKRWNQFCPEECSIPEDLTHDQIEEWVMVSGYQLQSHSLDFGPKGKELTFSGYCEYRTTRNTPIRIKQILHVLLRFSFFAGIGYGTPKGMGQVNFLTFDR